MKLSTQAANHPKKGSVLIIEPLRSLEDVAKVKAVLKDHPRNLALFVTGINTSLRASDLLTIRNSDIDWKRGELRLREKKTGKKQHIYLSAGVLTAIQAIRKDGDQYLFRSEKTGKPLTVSALNNLVKLWCFRAGIDINAGSHTLRKTFCRLHWDIHKTPIEILSQMMNHSSPRVTYRYMGIIPEDYKNVYLKEL